MKKIKIGVLGAYRGTSMINYCKRANNAEVVAICDKSPEAIETQQKFAEGLDITYYDNFEDFIKHDMDAVVLANYAHQHAPFAIRAMKEGKHVFSEVVPVQTMKEAVELVEAVEETGLVYAYGENYCYMPCTTEMKKLYKEGVLGELEYAECEYIHNCESIWHSITYGERDHWRNNMYSTFYCTHSLGPIVHITGLRPVQVTGYEGLKNARKLRMGAKGAAYGLEMVKFENEALVKSIHGGLYKDSIWYSLYGSKGRIESGREDTFGEGYYHLYVNCDEYDGQYEEQEAKYYKPELPDFEKTKGFGHGGSDFYSMWHFIEKIKGDPDADIIDVYEAMDMFLPGMFAYLSILDGGVPKDIPDMRDKAQRDKWRNFTACTDAEAAGDMLLPTFSKGTPEIPDEVYQTMYTRWQDELKSGTGYIADAFSQGSEDSKFNK